MKIRLTTTLLALFALLSTSIFAVKGSGWLPSYSDQLGVKLEKVPAVDEAFEELKGTVIDPLKLAGLGIRGLEAGDPVTVRHAGSVKWETEVEGKRIQPCKLRLRAVTKSRVVTLVPDQKTVQLKLATPPPYRSSMKRRPQ